MKKIIIILIFIMSFSLYSTNVSYAADSDDKGYVNFKLSSKLPGLKCDETIENKGKTKSYKCRMGRGSAGVILVLQDMLRYFTFISGLLAVLMIVYGGILYTMSGIDASFKETAKKRIGQILAGLILLLLSGYLLQFIASWVYR